MRIAATFLIGSLLLSVPALAEDYGQANGPDGDYDWSGYYVGIQAGGFFNASRWSGAFTTFNTNGSSLLIGGQAGYLRQFDNNWVLGIEAELSGASLSATGQCSTSVGTVCRTRQNWIAAARGRVGRAFDRLQIYGTAGVAFTDYRFDQTLGVIQSWDDGTRVGWTAGLGVEYAVTSKWSAGVEWKHYDFGTKTGQSNLGVFPINFRETSDHFVARINYRF